MGGVFLRGIRPLPKMKLCHLGGQPPSGRRPKGGCPLPAQDLGGQSNQGKHNATNAKVHWHFISTSFAQKTCTQDPAALAQHSTVGVSLSVEFRWLTLWSRCQYTIGSSTQVKSSSTCSPVFLSGSLVYVMAVGGILAESVWQVIG